ncbi:MAG: leucine-rich repeat domain-containing protein, partial [Clostridia bacterium]|nr:leucine-rich repeat domain-containing protein [Clostridia bacterium]
MAFALCDGLTAVTIPDSVTSIGFVAFSSCAKLKAIVVSPGNPVYADLDGVLYTKALDSIVAYPAGKEESAYRIPAGVTSIGDYAFAYCGGLTSVTIPDSVTSIGEAAFGRCGGLTSVSIPDSVTSIGAYAFADCTGLTSVTIPDSVTNIGEKAFASCTGLTNVTIPDSVTSIGKNVFDKCGEGFTVTCGEGS